MTPLEKALSEGGEDVTDTPLGRALRAGGEKVTASKYPAPKSFSASDEDVGLGERPSKREMISLPGGSRIVAGDFGATPTGEFSRQQRESDINDSVDNVKRVESALGGAAIGGALGNAAKIGLAARGAGAAAEGGVVGRAAKVIEQAIENSYHHGGIFGTAAKVAQTVAPGVTGAVTKTATQVIPAAIGAGTVAAATAAPQVANQIIPPAGGKISNAVERLRASSAGNPRAAELMSKIDAMQSPAFPAANNTGTVTQSTLGGSE